MSNVGKEWASYNEVFQKIWEDVSGTRQQCEERAAKLEAEKLKQKAEAEKEKERKRRYREVTKEFDFQLQKLSLKKGDIVIVHLTSAPKPGLSELMRQLMTMKPILDFSVPVLVIPMELELSTISEAEMNKAGWFKRGHRLVRPVT